MKVFIINLARSIDRRHSIAAQCDKLGLEYEFFPAVDGSTLSESECAQNTQPLNYAFKPGEIGCALSHLAIYKKMVAENIQNAFILEDDAQLSDDLGGILSHLNMQSFSTLPTVLLLSKVNKLVKNKYFDIDNKYSVYPALHATTAHAYIINLTAAKNLINLLFPVWMVADKWSLFEDYSAIKVFCIYPEPVVLTDYSHDSTIIVESINEEVLSRKENIWRELMSHRPLKVKIKHRLRRILTPLLNQVIDVKALRKQGE